MQQRAWMVDSGRPRPRAVHSTSLAFIPTGPTSFDPFLQMRALEPLSPFFRLQSGRARTKQVPRCKARTASQARTPQPAVTTCLGAGRGPELQAPAGGCCAHGKCPWRPAVYSQLCPYLGLVLVKVTCVLDSGPVRVWTVGHNGRLETFRDTWLSHCGLEIYY